MGRRLQMLYMDDTGIHAPTGNWQKKKDDVAQGDFWGFEFEDGFTDSPN